MIYLLDTNVVSELMKGDAGVVRRLAEKSREEVVIPQPVWAELSYGLARLPQSKRKERLERQLRLIGSEIARTEWTDEVSARFGQVKAELERRGVRIEDFDAAIAAHALALDATLVTANVRHLGRISELSIEVWSR